MLIHELQLYIHLDALLLAISVCIAWNKLDTYKTFCNSNFDTESTTTTINYTTSLPKDGEMIKPDTISCPK